MISPFHNEVLDIYKRSVYFNSDPVLSNKSLFLSWISQLSIPKTYIEIGVYILDNFGFMHGVLPSDVEMLGFDLFELPDKEEHWMYNSEIRGKPITYFEAKSIVGDWDRKVGFIKGDTRETLSNTDWSNTIEYPVLVFLDGGHSYDTVKSDFWNVYNKIESGFIVIDDWINPKILGNSLNFYNRTYHTTTDPNAYMFGNSQWKFAKELDDDPNINVMYIFDHFCDENLDCIGIVQKK